MALHFVGCLHNDPDAEERVQVALEQLKPCVITLEYHGEELQALREGVEFREAMNRYHDLARTVLNEHGFSAQAYDEANRVYEAWFGEVRGTLAWAAKTGTRVHATEDPTQQMEHDRKLLESPEKAVQDFVQWIHGLAGEGKSYNPFSHLPTDLSPYQLFEDHLAGRSDEEIVRWVDSAKEKGLLNPKRLRHQMWVMRDALGSTELGSERVHVGGALHAADAGTLEPPTLYQQVRREFPELSVVRHSLRSF